MRENFEIPFSRPNVCRIDRSEVEVAETDILFEIRFERNCALFFDYPGVFFLTPSSYIVNPWTGIEQTRSLRWKRKKFERVAVQTARSVSSLTSPPGGRESAARGELAEFKSAFSF